MKIKIIIAIAVLGSAFSSCRKCETCTPYLANGMQANSATYTAQAVKVCRKAEIDAYETGKNFTDAQGDSIHFLCIDTL